MRGPRLARRTLALRKGGTVTQEPPTPPTSDHGSSSSPQQRRCPLVAHMTLWDIHNQVGDPGERKRRWDAVYGREKELIAAAQKELNLAGSLRGRIRNHFRQWRAQLHTRNAIKNQRTLSSPPQQPPSPEHQRPPSAAPGSEKARSTEKLPR